MNDAKLLAALRRGNASRVVTWTSALKNGHTIEVKINYPLDEEVPNEVLAAVNKCIGECAAAYVTAPQEGTDDG